MFYREIASQLTSNVIEARLIQPTNLIVKPVVFTSVATTFMYCATIPEKPSPATLTKTNGELPKVVEKVTGRLNPDIGSIFTEVNV